MAGDGELRARLEAKISAHGLVDRVRITGWLSDAAIREELQQASILIQPSFAEGLPVVIMEAFAMGRPVISTHVAGIPELVRAGENGWLVPAGDTDELMNAIRDALETPAARLREMGAAGRTRVRNRHRIVTEVARLEELLMDTLMKGSTS